MKQAIGPALVLLRHALDRDASPGDNWRFLHWPYGISAWNQLSAGPAAMEERPKKESYYESIATPNNDMQPQRAQ